MVNITQAFFQNIKWLLRVLLKIRMVEKDECQTIIAVETAGRVH